jgi:hypothetical protein
MHITLVNFRDTTKEKLELPWPEHISDPSGGETPPFSGGIHTMMVFICGRLLKLTRFDVPTTFVSHTHTTHKP